VMFFLTAWYVPKVDYALKSHFLRWVNWRGMMSE
jgi:hypothetical protein